MSRKCKKSWLDTYLEYAHDQESPTAFHEWVGLSVLSACLGRHVWIPRIKYTIFPNLFTILVAGSGMCRKSVSISIGLDVLSEIEKPPMVFAQKLTTEALIQALEEAKIDGASAGIICSKELATFLGADATKSGIIPALTDLYDSPKEWVYHTRGRGKEVLRNVTITFLSASTKEWLRTAIPPDAVGGGFTSRIIFVCRMQPSKPLLFPIDDTNTGVLKSHLIHDLNIIRTKIRGPMEFTPQARKISEDWYMGEWNKIRDPKLDGYFSRKHDTMFKIASILSAAESSNKMIDHTHINRALELLVENEQHLGGIIASVVASAIGGDAEKVLDIIKRHKVITHSELLRRCWRFTDALGLNDHVRTLVESDQVKERMSGDNRSRVYEIKRA